MCVQHELYKCVFLFKGPVNAVWQRQEPLYGGQKSCGGQKHRSSHQNYNDSLHSVHSLCAVGLTPMSTVRLVYIVFRL